MARKAQRDEPVPGQTIDKREAQLVNLAIDLAEKQLREGTAPASVITHYIKIGTTREQLEMERLRHENNLLEAKRDALKAQERTEELFREAISAFKSYHGDDEDDYEDDPDDY